MPEFAHEFPLCSELMSGFERHWLLYVAALYHDIAKGRGGDHSHLGSADAKSFCRRHGIAREDARARRVPGREPPRHVARRAEAGRLRSRGGARVRRQGRTERRLVALYLLTVADVRGTSPKVWNALEGRSCWRISSAPRGASLTGEPLARDAALAEKQAEAARLLRLYALSDGVKDKLWAQLDITYFLRHDAQEIAWHTRNLHYRVDADKPVVKARLAPFGEGLQVMIYTTDREALFARICGYFERAGFNIAEAKVHTTRNGYALDTFMVMGQGRDAHYQDRIAMIEAELAEELEVATRRSARRAAARLSRRVRHFPISPIVDIRPDERGAYQVLSLVASDRPGLLYGIARMLAQLPHQPAHRAHQHARRPRGGRVPGRRARRSPRRRRCCSSSRSSSPSSVFRRQFLSWKQRFVEAELRQVADAHRIEDAVEVVALVLHHAGVETRHVALERLARSRRIRDSAGACSAAPRRACPGTERQPSQPSSSSSAERREHRVDEHRVGHLLGIRDSAGCASRRRSPRAGRRRSAARRGRRRLRCAIVSRMSCSSARSSGVSNSLHRLGARAAGADRPCAAPHGSLRCTHFSMIARTRAHRLLEDARRSCRADTARALSPRPAA